jgi:hypothetical protein
MAWGTDIVPWREVVRGDRDSSLTDRDRSWRKGTEMLAEVERNISFRFFMVPEIWMLHASQNRRISGPMWTATQFFYKNTSVSSSQMLKEIKNHSHRQLYTFWPYLAIKPRPAVKFFPFLAEKSACGWQQVNYTLTSPARSAADSAWSTCSAGYSASI